MREIFVGGTGRSGTTIVGQLLGHHPDIAATFPKEVRFITDRGGLLDLISSPSPAALDAFLRHLTGKWWSRTGPDGGVRGLHRGIDRSTLDHAVQAFTAGFPNDPRAAAFTLTHTLLDPMAEAAGAGAWAETTPANAQRAAELQALFSELRVVHVRRDPRDTIASVVAQAWGPSTVAEAIDWWRHSHAAASAATADRPWALTIDLEDLVLRRRDEVYSRLLAFVEVGDDLSVRAFFDEEVTDERAGIGRWHGLPEEDRSLLTAEFGDGPTVLTGAGGR